MFNVYVLFTAFILDVQSCLKSSTFVSHLKSLIHRVVKSSQLPVKIAAFLVCIGRLLCLAFLYRWCFLNKISLDWPLTLTTQLSTSKLSDNPGYSMFLKISWAKANRKIKWVKKNCWVFNLKTFLTCTFLSLFCTAAYFLLLNKSCNSNSPSLFKLFLSCFSLGLLSLSVCQTGSCLRQHLQF